MISRPNQYPATEIHPDDWGDRRFCLAVPNGMRRGVLVSAIPAARDWRGNGRKANSLRRDYG